MVTAAESSAQQGGNVLQCLVPDGVAVGIVHRFEAIHVYNDEGKGGIFLLKDIQQPFKRTPVEQIGNGIVIRLVADQRLRRFVLLIDLVIGLSHYL